ATQPRLQHRCRGRTQILDALLKLRVQVRRIEALRVQRRREQIAVRQQARRDFREIVAAIRHVCESRIMRERIVETARQIREPCLRRTGNRQQQQSRTRSLADLVEQKFLIGGARRWYEVAQVGTDLQVQRDAPADRGDQYQPCEPDRDARATPHWLLRQRAASADSSGALLRRPCSAIAPTSVMLLSPLESVMVRQRGSWSRPSMTSDVSCRLIESLRGASVMTQWAVLPCADNVKSFCSADTSPPSSARNPASIAPACGARASGICCTAPAPRCSIF